MRSALAVLGVATGAIAALLTLGSPHSDGLKDPAALVATGLWWLAIVTAVYFMALAGAAVVGQVARVSWLLATIRVLTIPALRAIVLPAALTGSHLLVTSPAAANERSNSLATEAPAVMVVVDNSAAPPALMVLRDDPASQAGPTPGPAAPSGTAQIPVTEPPPTADIDGAASTANTSADPTTGTSIDVPNDAMGSDGSDMSRVHIVAPGEHCWSIAAHHVAARLGAPPTVAEVAAFWRQLLSLNQDRFVTGDPDLIYPGQQLLLP